MGGGVLAATEPAPVVVADGASHVVTARYLLNQSRALLTLLDIFGILPVFDVPAEGPLATRLGVSLAAATVADERAAFGAFAILLLSIGADQH